MNRLPVIVDVHAHILPGVDDGSGSMEESLKMLEMAAAEGIGAVVATPHYSHRRGITGYQELIQELRQRVQQKLPSFQLYLGQETYYKEELLRDLENGRALPLNGSRYVLWNLIHLCRIRICIAESVSFCLPVMCRSSHIWRDIVA